MRSVRSRAPLLAALLGALAVATSALAQAPATPLPPPGAPRPAASPPTAATPPAAVRPATPPAATPPAGTPPAGTPPAAAPGATTTTTPPAMDAGTYAVRLRDLEQRINELREQVFRSKGRLALLAESVLEGTVGGSELLIRHENRMSGTFELTRVVYLLDGAQIFPSGESLSGEALAEAETFDIYRGSIVPGEHTLSITLEYRGNGHGVFAYLEGYRFTVRSSHSFTAPEGRAMTLRVVGLESGGQTTPIEDRPTVRFVEAVTDELAPEGEPTD